MLTKISDLFHSFAKGRLILLLFIIFILITSISLPIIYHFYPNADKMVSLDGPTFYTPDETFSILEAWGDVGRSLQFWFHLTWDLVVPILYLTFFGLFISWLTQRGFKPLSKMQRMNLITLGSLFDLLENICIGILILFYPSKPIVIAWIKSIISSVKYIFGIAIILIIFVSLIMAIKNKFKDQRIPIND